MSWAKFAIEALRRGETAQIRPRGHSMRGKVDDGDLVTLEVRTLCSLAFKQAIGLSIGIVTPPNSTFKVPLFNSSGVRPATIFRVSYQRTKLFRLCSGSERCD